MHPRAVRRVDRAVAARDVEPGRGLGRLQPATSSSSKPQVRSCSTCACSRGTCTAAVASSSVPPLEKCASIPSAAATAPTSSTVANSARWSATAASRPCAFAVVSRLPANNAEHQPPLRPDAPNPAISASRTAIRSVGSRRASVRGPRARCSRHRRWRRRRRCPDPARARGVSGSGSCRARSCGSGTALRPHRSWRRGSRRGAVAQLQDQPKLLTQPQTRGRRRRTSTTNETDASDGRARTAPHATIAIAPTASDRADHECDVDPERIHEHPDRDPALPIPGCASSVRVSRASTRVSERPEREQRCGRADRTRARGEADASRIDAPSDELRLMSTGSTGGRPLSATTGGEIAKVVCDYATTSARTDSGQTRRSRRNRRGRAGATVTSRATNSSIRAASSSGRSPCTLWPAPRPRRRAPRGRRRASSATSSSPTTGESAPRTSSNGT